MIAAEKLDPVASIRSFNRFYTRQIGLLNEGLLKSEFSLTEVRVLYELAHRDDLTASELGRDLTIDDGYLSRILKKFESRNMVERVPSSSDGRQSLLRLTDNGRQVFQPLEACSHEQIAELIKPLSANEQSTLLSAMQTIKRILDEQRKTSLTPIIFRTLQPGDIGWIIHRQGLLYAQEYDWDETFEALVAEIAAAFVQNFQPQSERCWIAERDDEIVGSVFLVRESDDVAKLRLLYVEPSARGLGIGRKLVQECIKFARLKGYKTLTLWTNDVLTSARRIYEQAGFELVEEKCHHSFGKDLLGQNWSLDLRTIS